MLTNITPFLKKIPRWTKINILLEIQPHISFLITQVDIMRMQHLYPEKKILLFIQDQRITIAVHGIYRDQRHHNFRVPGKTDTPGHHSGYQHQKNK